MTDELQARQDRSGWVALFKKTFADWYEHNAARLAAALAYYTIFALAPVLVISISVAGMIFGRDAVEGEVVGQLAGLVGPDSATVIQQLLANARKPAEGIIATLVGFVALLLGATGIVGELKAALNAIWEVPPQSLGPWAFVRNRVAALALILALGFTMLVSLVLSAALAAANRYFQTLVPGSESVWIALGGLTSLAFETVLFALIFQLPDVRVRWSDVWLGALATAVLFEIGKLLVGLYLGGAGIASAFGAAGSLVVVLVWVYYSAQILFLGAEFTQVYARRNAIGPQAATTDRPPAYASSAMAVGRERPSEAQLRVGLPTSQTRRPSS